MPDDCNYEKIANLYYNELKKIKGGNHVRYYSADPFHEGGIRDGIDIGNYALENFRKMQEHSENAVWVLQEWGEPKPEITQSIPDGGMLMLSLTTDRKNPDEEDAREWHGLLEDFYKPRWERFISRLELSLITGKRFLTSNSYDEEIAFVFEKKKYPSRAFGNLKESVEDILKKVKSVKIDYKSYSTDTLSFEENVVNDIEKSKKF